MVTVSNLWAEPFENHLYLQPTSLSWAPDLEIQLLARHFICMSPSTYISPFLPTKPLFFPSLSVDGIALRLVKPETKSSSNGCSLLSISSYDYESCWFYLLVLVSTHFSLFLLWLPESRPSWFQAWLPQRPLLFILFAPLFSLIQSSYCKPKSDFWKSNVIM